ncbi:MAG: type II 3-dehydroquinate dehydratase [Acetobacteraceae bacterium]|nr:type II 3-dehydroquinate dehydratase [Acetobacteraceae bacterium]
MPKILVIHGAGMNMRGKAQVETFGPMTLSEYDTKIRAFAAELGVEVEIFHSNIEGEIINKIYAAHEEGVIGALFNPAGFTTGYRSLNAAITQVNFPTIEVHMSNPAKRGTNSEILAASLGGISGFGIAGYALGLRGLRDRNKT